MSDIPRREFLAAAAAAAVAAACGKADTTTRAQAVARPAQGKMPTLYLPHGAGPCFFMDWRMGPANTWDKTAAWLRGIPATLPQQPSAILVVSAHWEMPTATVTAHAKPPLIYDYTGFPKHTYALQWPAPGAPAVAERVQALLTAASIPVASDSSRGFDHGVFIPLLLPYPEPTIPTLQLSLVRGLDPAAHVALGRALAPLRDEGVLLVGSGMSYHNMRGFGREASAGHSRTFDGWLEHVTTQSGDARRALLADWKSAPSARACHPREEHLLPMMVVGAAADEPGRVVFRDHVMGVDISAHQFG